jgi:hypothetical protein
VISLAADSQPAEKHPIHGYVCADVHGRFEAYRREIGLTSGSALLTLLVLRELQLQRLGALPLTRDGTVSMPRESKVSAYIDADKFAEFKGLSDALGRSTSDCAADLIARELEERWLKTVLATAPAESAG